MGGSARGAWWVFVAAGAVHLAGQAAGIHVVQQATKPLLVPALLAWFLATVPDGRTRTWVAAGLALSWLGDLGLMGGGDGWFLAGLGMFLLAQLAYATAFWPHRREAVLTRPPLLLPYLVALIGLLGVLWPGLEDLRVPVTVYAVVIVTMAVLATGLGPTVAVGAALFVVSDALIALGSLTGLLRLPAHGFWVMATYLAAQAAIARGVRDRLAGSDPADAPHTCIREAPQAR